MINPSFQEFREINESRYAIVMIASKRARQLVNMSKPLVETRAEKPVTIAIEELMSGKIEYTAEDIPSIK
ncbi:MAG: DNA-directed RNA polymerase subunit omega [Tissierellia bacterium]|nr:DNA-directed RNA polymerase subunit omega [Tissierellia bacterium]